MRTLWAGSPHCPPRPLASPQKWVAPGLLMWTHGAKDWRPSAKRRYAGNGVV